MNLISFMKNVIFKKTTNMGRLVKVELVNIEEAEETPKIINITNKYNGKDIQSSYDTNRVEGSESM